MKRLTLFLVLHILCFVAFSQDVKLKKGVVYLDGKASMLLKVKKNSENFVLYDITGMKEILFYNYNNNGTQDDASDDNCRIVFTSAYQSMISDELIHMPKKLIIILAEAGIFDVDGQLIKPKVEEFIEKYDIKQRPKLNSIESHKSLFQEE